MEKHKMPNGKVMSEKEMKGMKDSEKMPEKMPKKMAKKKKMMSDTGTMYA